MTKHRITLLGSLDKLLRDWLVGHPQGHERAALVLFRRLARPVDIHAPSDRFLAVETIRMEDDWILDSSVNHLTINMRKLPSIYYRCEAEGLELGFVHSHPPSSSYEFSPQDDTNELNILHGLSGCNGEEAFLIAMTLRDELWSARIRRGKTPDTVMPVRHIAVLGESLKLHGIDHSRDPIEILQRQEAAFGKPFNDMLRSLRIAVVGVGGTGSSVATLLARAGVGELILIDHDHLDKTNLNRVRGFRLDDQGKNKAEVLAQYIDNLGLSITVTAIDELLNESGRAVDALSSADVVFGCTDDHGGRDLMNQAMYYYAQVYIDMGLTGFIDKDSEGVYYLRDHRGRVSCLFPEGGACLRCQRVVKDEQIRYEQELRATPELAKLDAATLQREYYLVGGGEQAPV